MNPQFHDEFIVLCALFFADELSDEEWALLQVHLAYCHDCRTKFEEYQQLHADVVPLMAVNVAAEHIGSTRLRGFSVEAAEKRLIAKLDPAPVKPEPKSRPTNRRTLLIFLAAACVVGISCLLYFAFVPPRRSAVQQPTIPERSLRSSVPAASPSHNVEARSEPKTSELDATKLHMQLSKATAQYRQATQTAAEATQQLATTQTEWKKTSEERDALRQQLTNAQSEIQSLNAKAAATAAADQERVERLATLEAKLRDLNTSLDEKDRMLALDKDFLAHDREIRDLIAARDLYITDIFDVKDDGQTAKPFGRIFYTKDKSLVFYGYDLDRQAGHKESVAFQAWGSGDAQTDVSLGLFYQDGTQRRWILRFSDTRTLARLNKVFVTVEPHGGSAKPTGKQILMAYLRVQPNHP